MKTFMLAIGVCFFSTAFSQNTLSYNEAEGSPKADLSSLSWLPGHWQGTAWGGIIDEVWTPALGGSMECAFKMVKDDKVDFYEMLTITEEEGTLILRLKHFYPKLKGWETKDESLEFRLVKVTPTKVYFNGFTFEKENDQALNVYVKFTDNGQSSEMKFHYKRKEL
jgi:hypothetical protein